MTCILEYCIMAPITILCQATGHFIRMLQTSQIWDLVSWTYLKFSYKTTFQLKSIHTREKHCDLFIGIGPSHIRSHPNPTTHMTYLCMSLASWSQSQLKRHGLYVMCKTSFISYSRYQPQSNDFLYYITYKYADLKCNAGILQNDPYGSNTSPQSKCGYAWFY